MHVCVPAAVCVRDPACFVLCSAASRVPPHVCTATSGGTCGPQRRACVGELCGCAVSSLCLHAVGLRSWHPHVTCDGRAGAVRSHAPWRRRAS
eukprot:4192658-Prymnesium_polylepis.1